MPSSEPAVRRSAGLLVAGALAILPAPLLAQAPVPPPAPTPTPPGGRQADLIDQNVVPSREQVGLPAPDAATGKPRVRVNGDQAIAAAPCPLANYDVQVQLRSIRFVGPSTLTANGGTPIEAKLAPEITTLLSDIAAATPPGAQPVRVVCDIRDKATERLRRAGYVASVQIPPQRIEDGELKLEVITAKIVEVRVRGDAGPYRDTLAARIEKLKELSPLNERDAERILLLAGDIPGVDVQLALRPGSGQPGEVIGELTVVYRRFSVLGNLQNYGSRQLGRETGYARAEVYGLTGASDVTFVGASSTADFDEQIVAQAGHVMGLGPNGTTLAGSFTYAWSRPDIGALDLRSESLIGALELRQPLVRSVLTNATVSGGMEIIEQRTRVYSDNAAGMSTSSALNRDKLRVLFARAEGSTGQRRPDGGDRWFVRGKLELRKGLGILNATKRGVVVASGYSPSRFEGDPKATVIRGELDTIFGIGPVFSLYGGARGQWSNHPLLNFEEYALGNLTFGRGYDPGANSADRAIAVRGELRAKVVDRPTLRAELFGFYDSVWIYNLDTNAIENDRRLGSFGGGARVTLPNRALLEVAYARPTNKALLIPGAKRSTDRLLVSLTAQFAPGAR